MSISEKLDIIRQYDAEIATELARLYNGLRLAIANTCLLTLQSDTYDFYDNRFDAYLDSYISYVNMIVGNSSLGNLIEEGITSNYSYAALSGRIVDIDFDNIVSFKGLKTELPNRPDDYFFTSCVEVDLLDPENSILPDESVFEVDETRLSDITDITSSIQTWQATAQARVRGTVMKAMFETIQPPGLTKEELAHLLYCSTNLYKFLEKYQISIYKPPYLSCE